MPCTMKNNVKKYSLETDVIVIGYGGAGAAAAIAAYDDGAEVLILEKMSEGGGHTRVSGGAIDLPNSREYVRFLEILSYDNTPRDILERYVDESLKTEDWVTQLGGKL